ncbi:MAG: hypothetical protein PF517_06045, partial [Salinivirgaceae bacterium]|nr:hypothetical protein [Salinivirgaceae bacterium]
FNWFLSKNYEKLFLSWKFKLVVLSVSLLLINDCRNSINKKYDDWFYHDSRKIVEKVGDINPYLRSLGIAREDRVYYSPDPSHNISLYLMDQIGNTDYSLPFKSRVKNIEYLKAKGVKYFILGDLKLLEDDVLNNYLGNQEIIGRYKDVRIYRIN